jgi:hypothetical protein
MPNIKANSFIKTLTDKFRSSSLKGQTSEARTPVFALVGYLPDVSEKDAEAYAKSVAVSHMEMPHRSYYLVLPFAKGFLYEVHEGGQAKAFLPSIIKSLELQREAGAEIPRVFVKTSRRVVRIELEQSGPQAMLMPESCEEPTSEGLVQSSGMKPVEESNTQFLVLGAAIMTVGLAIIVGGATVREFNKIEIPEAIERTAQTNLPFAQWKLLENVEPGQYIAALKYENSRWTTIRKNINEPAPQEAIK